MVEQGLVGSHFGNISVREEEYIHITSTGSMLDELTEEEVVVVPLRDESPEDALASTELRVHRRVYALTEHNAVVHGHTPYAVILSMKYDSIKPVDAEGGYFLGEIPVVEGESGRARKSLGERTARGLLEAGGACGTSVGDELVGRTCTGRPGVFLRRLRKAEAKLPHTTSSLP